MLEDRADHRISRAHGSTHSVPRQLEDDEWFSTDLNPGERVCPTCHLVEPVAAHCC